MRSLMLGACLLAAAVVGFHSMTPAPWWLHEKRKQLRFLNDLLRRSRRLRANHREPAARWKN
jgi:hypothetical protein